MTYTEPLILVFLTISLIGLVRLRYSKSGRLAWLGVLGLILISWPPVDWLLSRPLEAGYPIKPVEAVTTQAIVVLAGDVNSGNYERPYNVLQQETYERCKFAAWLYQNFGPLPILVSGGPERPGQEPFSVTMREFLEQSGVSSAEIWTEEHSRSTHENATYSADILRHYGIQSITLVVEARSMPRAAACFRKVGLSVTPAPSGFREFGPLGVEWIPSWKAIRENEATLHETLGLVWYWLHGWV